jgi:hypothetical protein
MGLVPTLSSGNIAMAFKKVKPDPKILTDPKVMMNYRLRASIVDAVAKAARDDGRSGTGMIEKILSDWLKERSYLR